jgi:hypothetical protein
MVAMESGTKVSSSARRTNGGSTLGTRGKGFGMPHHAPAYVAPGVVFCGILWRRSRKTIDCAVFKPRWAWECA